MDRQHWRPQDLTKQRCRDLALVLPRPLLQSYEGMWIGFYVFVVILGLGGPTGIAANPARDFSPRLAHWLLPIQGAPRSTARPALLVATRPTCPMNIPSLWRAPNRRQGPLRVVLRLDPLHSLLLWGRRRRRLVQGRPAHEPLQRP